MVLILLFSLICDVNGLIGSKKNVTVTGVLKCGDEKYSGVTVELWEADKCQFFFFF